MRERVMRGRRERERGEALRLEKIILRWKETAGGRGQMTIHVWKQETNKKTGTLLDWSKVGNIQTKKNLLKGYFQ